MSEGGREGGKGKRGEGEIDCFSLTSFRFAHDLYHSLGFDWLFLFMHATIHTETVVRAVRILVQLLSDHTLKQHFLNGTYVVTT